MKKKIKRIFYKIFPELENNYLLSNHEINNNKIFIEYIKKINPEYLSEKMKSITLVFAYYLNKEMLEKQIEYINKYPEYIKTKLKLIVVDDCSPVPARIFNIPGVDVSLYRTLEDIAWNQDFCRNLAVEKSDTEWLILTDIDHLVPVETLDKLMLYNFDHDFAYRFSRVNYPEMDTNSLHANTWFISKYLYKKIDGYDERLAGYYGSDVDFRNRLNKVAKTIDLSEIIIRVPRNVITDASTTTYSRNRKKDGKIIKSIISKRKNNPPITLSSKWKQIL